MTRCYVIDLPENEYRVHVCLLANVVTGLLQSSCYLVGDCIPPEDDSGAGGVMYITRILSLLIKTSLLLLSR